MIFVLLSFIFIFKNSMYAEKTQRTNDNVDLLLDGATGTQTTKRATNIESKLESVESGDSDNVVAADAAVAATDDATTTTSAPRKLAPAPPSKGKKAASVPSIAVASGAAVIDASAEFQTARHDVLLTAVTRKKKKLFFFRKSHVYYDLFVDVIVENEYEIA